MMTLLSVKKYGLIAFFLTGYFIASAQLNLGAVINEPLGLGIGVNSGITFSFTDVNKSNSSLVYGISGSYRPLDQVQIMLDFQKGRLKAGENEINRRYFENNYWYGSLTARIYPGTFAKSTENGIGNAFSFVYIGVGVGVLKSQTRANQVKEALSGYIHYYEGIDFLFPLEIGLNIPVIRFKYSDRSINLNLNYRSHFSFSDELDGYNPRSKSNKSKDTFSQLTIGLAYYF